MIRDIFEQRPELKKMILIVLLVIVLLIVGIVVFSTFKTTKLTYEQLEDKMQTAAIEYYETNKEKLPTIGQSESISYDSLVKAEKLKEMKKYLKNDISCDAKVVVTNHNEIYSYTSYLDCGENYKTVEFYNQVLSDNEIVTEKNGLYNNGSARTFRGENLNNFVEIKDNLWQIVKIDGDNTIKLILYSGKNKTVFDDRYNSERGYTVGKNVYNTSRLKELNESLYEDETMFDDNIKGKIIQRTLCVGGRNESEKGSNDSIECSETLDGQYLGALTLSEYIYSSLDASCNSAETEECQNYNYLAEDENNNSWWLVTPVKENTYQTYYISSYGSIDIANCSTNLASRPTIYLSPETIYSSGTGSLEDPYTIK